MARPGSNPVSDHILFQFWCPADGVIIFVITCPIDTRVVI